MNPMQNLFPPDSAVSRKLSLEELGPIFRDFYSRIENRVFKLERIQSYTEPDNSSYEQFKKGNWDAAIDLIPEIRMRDANLYMSLFQRNIHWVRVRAIELPPSSYLKWEFKTYNETARYGEKILVCNLMHDRSREMLWNTSDFMLFDHLGVLIHDYDANGLLTGAWLVEDADLIQHYNAVAREFVKSSVPLAVFEREHRQDLRPSTQND